MKENTVHKEYLNMARDTNAPLGSGYVYGSAISRGLTNGSCGEQNTRPLSRKQKELMEAMEKEAVDARERRFHEQTVAMATTLRAMAPSLVAQLNQFQALVHEQMLRQGFWEGSSDNFASKCALVHSEVTELMEANRNGIQQDDKVPEFTGEEAEAADVFVRLMDMAGRYEWRFGDALVGKMLHNLSRPYKHGKKY